MSMAFNRISIDELANLPGFYAPRVSPDRKKIAYYGDKGGTLELYILEIGRESQQVSNGHLPENLHSMAPTWAADGLAIFFAKDTAGDEQYNVWKFDLQTAEAQQLTNNDNAQDFPHEAAANGKYLMTASNLSGPMGLYALNLANSEYVQLTDYESPVWSAQISPNGREVAYATNETEDPNNVDIYLMDADGGNKRRIIHLKTGSRENVGDWSKNGRYLAIDSDIGGTDRVGVYDLATRTLKWITPGGKNYTSGKFSPDSKRILVLMNEDSLSSAQVYDVDTGTNIPVKLPDGICSDMDWLDNDRFIVKITTDISRAQLITYSVQFSSTTTVIEAEYGSTDPAVLSPHEYVWYPSIDGTQIPAILYRPQNAAPGQKYPAIVHAHGGPTMQYLREFDIYAQYLLDRGFVVLQPNVRGSTGYGTEFRDACIKDWGGKDLEDIEAGKNFLASLPEVDPERIGIMGKSYGGYITYMALTKKPGVFKAGAAWVGLTDLHKLYASSQDRSRYYLAAQMGDPEQDRDLWIDRSAINFAHQLSDKILILHGVNDPRAPIEQARIFRDRLLELGKIEGNDFEYVEFEEEGHGSDVVSQAAKQYRLIVDFMERHL